MRKRSALMGCAAAVALALGAQEPVEFGPFPTREMFPLFLPTLAYQPADPTPLGEGRWRVSVDHIRANTFEFSDLLKEEAPRDIQGRIRVTREDAQELAAQHPSIPLIFYLDEEIVRTTLRLRRGLGDRTDVWAELPFQWHGGGHLDSLIEGFHKLGFDQFGREFIARDRLTLAVMSRGELVFYSEESIRGKFQDPSIGITRSVAGSANWLLSATAALKLPLTTSYGEYRSGWDFSLGLTGRWQPAPRHVFYFGGAFIGRPPGSHAYNELAFGGLRDGWGAHGTWEYRKWPRFRPFFQLYAQSGYLPKQPYQKLDRPSLQHDLGFHWTLWGQTVLTFRYLNNITHNENTADMGLGLSLDTRF